MVAISGDNSMITHPIGETIVTLGLRLTRYLLAI